MASRIPHRARAVVEAFMRWAVLGLIAGLAACATQPPPPPAPSGPARAPSAPAPRPSPGTPPPASTTPAASSARNLDDYKREIALRIQQRNAQWVHDERPQALLRAVIVARLKVDVAGNAQVEILRSPDAELTQRVIQSVRNASPFPVPTRSLASQLAGTGYTESWLFNTDGRFQIRTVARPQMDQ